MASNGFQSSLRSIVNWALNYIVTYQLPGFPWVGVKPGLWTLDWTHGLDCGLRFGLDFGLIRRAMTTISKRLWIEGTTTAS